MIISKRKHSTRFLWVHETGHLVPNDIKYNTADMFQNTFHCSPLKTPSRAKTPKRVILLFLDNKKPTACPKHKIEKKKSGTMLTLQILTIPTKTPISISPFTILHQFLSKNKNKQTASTVIHAPQRYVLGTLPYRFVVLGRCRGQIQNLWCGDRSVNLPRVKQGTGWWWFTNPIWKNMRMSKLGSSPQVRVKIK